MKIAGKCNDWIFVKNSEEAKRVLLPVPVPVVGWLTETVQYYWQVKALGLASPAQGTERQKLLYKLKVRQGGGSGGIQIWRKRSRRASVYHSCRGYKQNTSIKDYYKTPFSLRRYLEDIIEVVVETIQTKLINYGIYRWQLSNLYNWS